MEARRAHNPEVVGSSPASATKIIPDFDKKSGIFLTFVTILPRPQIHFRDSLGIAQNHGWENPNFFIENGFSVNSAIFFPQTPPPGHPQLLLWQWQSGVRKLLPLCLRWRDPVPRLLSPGQHRWQSSYWSFRRMASAAAICSFVGVGTPSSG